MQYPGYARLDAEFRKIPFLCDVTITEALANQTINRAQHSHFFPKDTHEVNVPFRQACMNFPEAVGIVGCPLNCGRRITDENQENNHFRQSL